MRERKMAFYQGASRDQEERIRASGFYDESGPREVKPRERGGGAESCSPRKIIYSTADS